LGDTTPLSPHISTCIRLYALVIYTHRFFLLKETPTLLGNFCVILDMNKRNIMYGLAYGISIGVGVAITFGVALENMAIGILMGLGSGISLGVGCSLLLSKRKSC